MASEKGLYWLAVGMMGLFFINSAAVRHQDWLNNLEDRTIQVTQRLSGGTIASLDPAVTELRVHTRQCARTRMTAEEIQTKLTRMEAAMSGREACLEARRAQLEALQHMHAPMMRANRNFVIDIPQVKAVPSDGTI
jgi:hypothetical protein